MATLSGQTIANTFDSLLHVEDDTAGLVATSTDSRVIQDGVGAASALALATDSVRITSTNKLYFNDVGGEYLSGDGTDLTITSGNDIKLAVGAAGSVHSAGVAGTSNTVLGVDAGIGLEAGSNYNVLIGDTVGDASMNDATNNVGVGYGALSALTQGDNNIAIGHSAGAALDVGGTNVLIGAAAGDALNGSYAGGNVFIGDNAGGAATTVGNAVAIGRDAMANAATLGNGNADYTVAIGREALYKLTEGMHNTAVGYQSMYECLAHGDDSTALGYQALKNWVSDTDTHGRNTAIGSKAALNLSTADNCIFIGYLAGGIGTITGNENVVVGNEAGEDLTSGDSNVFLGQRAGRNVAGGADNIIIGKEAGDASASITSTVLIGKNAGGSISDNTAVGSVLIGAQAGAAVTTGAGNTALGYQAGTSISTANYNIAIGHQALASMATGGGANVAIGYQCMTAMPSVANDNTAVGNLSMLGANHADADQNTCVGSQSGKSLTSGNKNTFIGNEAASTTFTTGTACTVLGSESRPSASGSSHQIVIGQGLAATADDAIHVGNATRHIRCDYGSDQTWDAGSDERIKDVTGDSPLGLDFLNSFPIITYNWKAPSEYPEEFNDYNADKTEPSDTLQHHGVTAQSVKASLDKIDGVTDFSGWSEDPDGMQTIGESAFVWPLIKAVQELTAKVKALEDAQ